MTGLAVVGPAVCEAKGLAVGEAEGLAVSCPVNANRLGLLDEV